MRMNWDEDRDGGEVRIDRTVYTDEVMMERAMAGGYSEGSPMYNAFERDQLIETDERGEDLISGPLPNEYFNRMRKVVVT